MLVSVCCCSFCPDEDRENEMRILFHDDLDLGLKLEFVLDHDNSNVATYFFCCLGLLSTQEAKFLLLQDVSVKSYSY